MWCVEVLAPYAAREAGHWCRVRVPGEDVPGATSREKRRVGAGRLPRPNTASHTHTSVCTVLHLVVFGESTLVSTMWPQRRCVQRSMQSAAVARSQRCTRLTILLDWHAAHVGGAASCALTSNSFVFLFKSQTRKSQRTSSCSLPSLSPNLLVHALRTVAHGIGAKHAPHAARLGCMAGAGRLRGLARRAHRRFPERAVRAGHVVGGEGAGGRNCAAHLDVVTRRRRRSRRRRGAATRSHL